MNNPITIEATVAVPIEKAWELWSEPKHITKWCAASEDWHTPSAENDLRVDGKFVSRMEAKDGSFGFDFGGVYTEVKPHAVIAYTMGDGRKAKIIFTGDGYKTKIVETFEPENQNPIEMQKGGWQAILNSFKKYAETHS